MRVAALIEASATADEMGVERHGRRAALVAAICALALLLVAGPASAAVGAEQGDTGALPESAQEVGPAGPLEAIEGEVAGFADRDVFKVCLTGGATFSASTVGNTGWDTQLFLLDSEGRAVYANDDSVRPWSTLPAGHPLTPAAAGVYYLAISAFNADPTGDAGPLFGSSSVGVVGPSRAGGARPMTGWVGTAAQPGGRYRIDLTGTRSCIPPDETAPAIDVRAPAEGAEYGLGQEVPADYSCDDGDGSGVASCDGDVPDGQPIDTSSLGPKTFTVVALDEKGNRGERTVSYDVVDRTDPAVDLRAPAEGAVFARGEQVEADFSCADAGGSGLAACDGDVPDGAPIDTATLGEKSFSVTARDGSGNQTTVTHAYTVVDRTAPAIEIRTPADGAVYAPGAQVAADFSCSDERGGSGLANCAGDVPDGAPLDTGEPGPRSFTVTARDAAGNTATRTVSYSVVFRFDFEGFYGLLDRPRVNVVRAGAVIPIAFSLDGYHGREIFASGYPRSVEMPCGSRADLDGGERTVGVGRVKLTYKRRRDLYIYLWKTDRRWSGDCRQFVLKLDDGSVHRADFRFASRGR